MKTDIKTIQKVVREELERKEQKILDDEKKKENEKDTKITDRCVGLIILFSAFFTGYFIGGL